MNIKSNPSTKKIVYFVRHGQSDDNVAPVFQSPDSPLSKEGNQQADFIAKRVSEVAFDVIISSPLRRTRQTAEIISEVTKKKVAFSELFVERIKPSSINGKPYTDKVANKAWRAWEDSLVTSGHKVEDGENYDEITIRADKALDYLLKRPEKTLLVVAHGYILRTIVARVLLGRALEPQLFKNLQRVMPMENTGITVMVYEGAFEQDPCWRLWIYNDHAHLAE